MAVEQTIWTFQDAVERLLENTGELKRDGRNYHIAIEAVMNAYREFPDRHDWIYYNRTFKFRSSPPYNEGTVTYDKATNHWSH